MSTRYLEGRMWLLHKGSAFLFSTPIPRAFPSFISFAVNESQTSNCVIKTSTGQVALDQNWANDDEK